MTDPRVYTDRCVLCGKTLAADSNCLCQAHRDKARPGQRMACGHPRSAAVYDGEGTAHCQLCEQEAEREVS